MVESINCRLPFVLSTVPLQISPWCKACSHTFWVLLWKRAVFSNLSLLWWVPCHFTGCARLLWGMEWLRLVGAIKLLVSFAEYCLFYRALLQKRPIILKGPTIRSHPIKRPIIVWKETYHGVKRVIVLKRTYHIVKRDLSLLGKRPVIVWKEMYHGVKRDHWLFEKRPTTVWKEAYYCAKRELLFFETEKRPIAVWKQAYYSMNWDVWMSEKRPMIGENESVADLKPNGWETKPVIVQKQPYHGLKRDLSLSEKRPIIVCKETNVSWKWLI